MRFVASRSNLICVAPDLHVATDSANRKGNAQVNDYWTFQARLDNPKNPSAKSPDPLDVSLAQCRSAWQSQMSEAMQNQMENTRNNGAKPDCQGIYAVVGSLVWNPRSFAQGSRKVCGDVRQDRPPIRNMQLELKISGLGFWACLGCAEDDVGIRISR